MTTTTPLPAVDFSRSGPITADEAAFVSQTPARDEFMVWVRHPSGGAYPVSGYYSSEAVAENIAHTLNRALGAWARFSIDPEGY